MESWQEIKFKNVVKQEYDFSCGSASISMLLQLHGIKVTEIAILDLLKKDYKQVDHLKDNFNNQTLENIASNNSLSMLDIKKVGEHYGFTVHALSFPFEKINQLKHPAIVHLETPKSLHYSVLISKNNNYFNLLDPTNGEITLSSNKFKKIYTGNLLIFQPKKGSVLLKDFGMDMKINPLIFHIF